MVPFILECFLLQRKEEKMGKYQAFGRFYFNQYWRRKENVLSVTHCMTRLRFTLKEDSIVNEKELLKSPEIMTAQFAAGPDIK